MAPRRAWVLNLDAEDELAAPRTHNPSRAMQARCLALVPSLAGLVAPVDIVLGAVAPRELISPGETLLGRAWCPTPRALAQIARAGAELPAAPPLSVLQRVNHRAFSAALGNALPGATFAPTMESAARVVAGPSPSGHWLLKRAYGYAGRGRMRVPRGDIHGNARAWLLRALTLGGVQVEPWVERAGDFALHGWLARDGACWLGAVTAQQCDARGAWVASAVAPVDALAVDERAALVHEATRAASALTQAGYFGPFGLDAFRWRDAQGDARFQPRSEVNARFTMGWATGMAGVALPPGAP